jgi:hypothetical protein
MTTHALHPPVGHNLLRQLGEPALGWREREPRLFAFGLLMLALMLPAALALGVDERMLRGVNVWVKPLKFMAAVSLLAFTSAWFIGHLDAAVRRGRTVRWLVATVIATGGFEVAYITLQAALGQASHYNVGDPFHGAMYTLMGIGATLLTGTQLVLGGLVWRHGLPQLAPAYRLSVVLGLVLTFLLGATVGGMLGGVQPPAGAGLPVVGWSTTGGDLRVAHFVGIHAGQVLPALGALAVLLRLPRATAAVGAGALAWTVLWGWTFAMALAGRP